MKKIWNPILEKEFSNKHYFIEIVPLNFGPNCISNENTVIKKLEFYEQYT